MNPVAPVMKYVVNALSSRDRSREGAYVSADFHGDGLRVARLVREPRGRPDAGAEHERAPARVRAAEPGADLEAPAGRGRRARERLVAPRAARAALDDDRHAAA